MEYIEIEISDIDSIAFKDTAIDYIVMRTKAVLPPMYKIIAFESVIEHPYRLSCIYTYAIERIMDKNQYLLF